MSIIQNIAEEVKASYKPPTSRDLTILALLFLLFPVAIGKYLVFWKGSEAGWYWVAAGIVLCLLRLIPPLFRGIYKGWFVFAVILGYFVSRILMTIIFFLLILPTGLIMRLLGKDPMERKWDPDAPSYWAPKEQEQDTSIERYERQF